MGLREQLTDDLKDAMRTKDDDRRRTIRSVIAAMKKAETELDSTGARVVLDDSDIMGVISKQAKQRQESIEAFQAGGREDLVARERAELAILEAYLPEQLTEAEIEEAARQVIAETGASGPQDLGIVMRPLMARLKGRADGRLVNKVVREQLSG
ncbi:GatB/YqeY domain-containing protein [Chloroflexota bacterium]